MKKQIKTKDDLLALLKKYDACTDATVYVREHPNSRAKVIWQTCDDLGWLLWLGVRWNPKVAAAYLKKVLVRMDALPPVSNANLNGAISRYKWQAYIEFGCFREEAGIGPIQWAAYYLLIVYDHHPQGAAQKALLLTDLRGMW